MQFRITTSSWLESLTKSECERLQLEHIQASDHSISCSWNLEDLYRLNISLRTANRVYIELWHWKADSFDTLFALVEKIDWEKYLPKNHPIIIDATSIRSILTHTPSIQKIGKKAVVNTLLHEDEERMLFEDDRLDEIHILILIIEDIAHILLDSSGEALHKRGYRKEQGEAPIKETLAAGLVMLARWKYSTPLIDPCCWSGTIAIEAALIARNIAPGLFRSFACEHFPFHEEEILEKVREEAEKSIYPTGKYSILWYDIDEEMIQIAQRNARRAWVGSDIIFKKQSITETKEELLRKNTESTLVSNPPYGIRLEQDDIDQIHRDFAELMRQANIRWWIITPYEPFRTYVSKDIFKERKLMNGSEQCRFWYKK